MSDSGARSGAERDLCRRQIETLVAENPQIRGALVASVDGFEVASSVRPPAAADKLAAMTSSLLSLAQAVCQEAGAGDCRDLVIEAGAGRVLMMDVPARRKLNLTVLCDDDGTLGRVLWAVRNTREAIAAALDALPAT